MLEELVALVVPPRCAACRAAGRGTSAILCAACRRALPWLARPSCPRCALPLPCGRECPARDAPFDAAWSAVAYEATARDAMRALKFAGARPLADVMAAQIACNAPRQLLPAGAVLVPVPAHPARRRARGFDPAELLARALARRTGLELERALRRGAASSRQLGASAAQRRAPGRLDIRAAGRAPRVAVLVDDVHTTGSTLAACAAALRGAGCGSVAAITWARALDPTVVHCSQSVHAPLGPLKVTTRGRTIVLCTSVDREDFEMKIEVKGRNVPVNDELRELVERKFRKVAAQVSDLARMEVELREERNPAIPDRNVAAVTLYLKGTTLHAEGASRELTHAVKLCSIELARQVKRHRDKVRRRREARTAPVQPAA